MKIPLNEHALSIEEIYELQVNTKNNIDLSYAPPIDFPMQIPKRLMDEIMSNCKDPINTRQSNTTTERLQLPKLGESKAWRQLQREIYNEETGTTFKPKVTWLMIIDKYYVA